MNESKLRELFKATNDAEPLADGWPGLLRFGLAVASAEREACAKVCDNLFSEQVGAVHVAAIRCASAIRKRSNAKVSEGENGK